MIQPSKILVVIALLAAAVSAGPAGAHSLLPIEPPQVVPEPPADPGLTRPAVALRPDGGFVAVFRDIGTGAVSGRWFAPARPDGTSETGFFEVDDAATRGRIYEPVVARGADGAFLALWAQDSPGPGVLMARAFDGEGRPLSETQAVAPGEALAFALAARPSGGFALAWMQRPDDGGELRVRILGPRGTPVGGWVEVGEATADVATVALAANTDGTLAVTWSANPVAEQAAGLHGRTLSAEGDPVGEAFEVVPPESSFRALQHDLAATAPAEFLVAWAGHTAPDDVPRALRVRTFDGAGALGPVRRLDATDGPDHPALWPALASGPEVGVVAWSEGDLAALTRARVVELDGRPLSPARALHSEDDEGDSVNGIDVDLDAEGRAAFGWGTAIDSPILPPESFFYWTSMARRFRVVDSACEPVLTLDFRTEPATPGTGDPVRLLFEGFADCAEVSLLDWSREAAAFRVEAAVESVSCSVVPPASPWSLPVEVGALEAGTHPVEIELALPGGGTCGRSFDVSVEADEPPPPPPPVDPPPPPDAPPLTSEQVPGFRAWVVITAQAGESLLGVKEEDCIPETLCVSGRVPGRSEVFVRIVGPKPNGRLWPTLVKFSTSTVEVWIEQTATGEIEYYRLEGARPGFDELPGLFDREGFAP